MTENKTENGLALDWDALDFLTEGSVWVSRQRSKVGWLYVIESAPFAKIGIAENPEARFNQMTSGNPHAIEFIGAWSLPHETMRRAEQYCHAFLCLTHHRNEWFEIDAKTAASIVRRVCRLAAKSRRTKSVKFGKRLKINKSVPKYVEAGLSIIHDAEQQTTPPAPQTTQRSEGMDET